MHKIILALVITILFGKAFPLVLLPVLVAGLALIMREAANREND